MQRIVKLGPTTVTVVGYGVSEKLIAHLLRILEEAYRLGGPDYLELHVYPDRKSMEVRLAEDAARLGVSVVAVYEVMHEAWHGYPRVHVSASTPTSLLKPLLVHEAMHALLHGSLEYYMPACSTSPIATHVAATAVKDLEVSVEMVKRGFRREVEKLAYMLQEPACSTIEGLSDVLRKYAMLLPLEVYWKPSCKGIEKALNLLHQAYLLTKKGRRAWNTTCRLAETVEEVVESYLH